MVVTGSRIPAPDVAKQGKARAAAGRSDEQSAMPEIDAYHAFFSRLQAGLKSNDRRAVLRLVGLPLRVTKNGRTQTYRSSQEVERDFDRIFTAQVRTAVLTQRPETLMRRNGNQLMGNGRIWFGPSCAGTTCSSSSPILIREVNP
jgi:hypothetical protein